MTAMLTKDELSTMLCQCKVKELARLSGVSDKTIYRLRQKLNMPNLATVQKLLDAIKAMQMPAKRLAKSRKPPSKKAASTQA